MKDNISIRVAKVRDINAIYSLGRKTKELEFSKNMNFHDRQELKQFILDKKESIVLVAEEDRKIVGFLYAKIITKTWCLLDNLVVEKDFREKGIGSCLLEEFYRILKKKKVSYVQILEEVHHKKTRNFWKGKGFKEERTFIWADKVIKNG